MITALGYVSSYLEYPEPLNIEDQIRAIGDFTRGNGLKLLQVFKDVGVLGGKSAFERDGFKQMINTAEALNVKTIVVYDLTRLSINILDLIKTYKWLLEHNYVIYFVKHTELNIEPYTQLGEALRKLLLSLFSVMVTLKCLETSGKHPGRKPVELPIDLIRHYRSQGLSKKDIYRLLVNQGYLTYREKNEVKVLSYDRFLRRLKDLGIQ